MKPVIQIYDSEEDVLRTLATAEKEGHLTETIIEEFVNKLFAMPVLWRCRKYFYMLDEDSGTYDTYGIDLCDGRQAGCGKGICQPVGRHTEGS